MATGSFTRGLAGLVSNSQAVTSVGSTPTSDNDKDLLNMTLVVERDVKPQL